MSAGRQMTAGDIVARVAYLLEEANYEVELPKGVIERVSGFNTSIRVSDIPVHIYMRRNRRGGWYASHQGMVVRGLMDGEMVAKRLARQIMDRFTKTQEEALRRQAAEDAYARSNAAVQNAWQHGIRAYNHHTYMSNKAMVGLYLVEEHDMTISAECLTDEMLEDARLMKEKVCQMIIEFKQRHGVS